MKKNKTNVGILVILIDDLINVVYHGTKKDVLSKILKEGLKGMDRQHVHLSPDIDTAKTVAGRRKGESVILVVKTHDMYNEGEKIYKSENGYYLADHVAPKYIEVYEAKSN